MLISIDHGNKFIKSGTSGKVFCSGLHESDTRPPFGEDILKYNGKYYTISDKRIPYLREKMSDDRFYILTLFAIAFEIEASDLYDHELMHVHLLVGLPPAHYGAQYERFEEYFKRGKIEEFEFRGTTFKILIKEALSFPQAFAAAMPVYKSISDNPKATIIDIGGFTVDYLLIKKGNPDLSVCDSLEHGVIKMYNQIISKVNSSLNLLLDESDIDSILKNTTISVMMSSALCTIPHVLLYLTFSACCVSERLIYILERLYLSAVALSCSENKLRNYRMQCPLASLN